MCPSLVFLSEPQAFQADINDIMDYVKGDYCHYLNSEDLHSPDLPLVTNHAVGGTLCLWRRSLDPFVTIYPATNSSFTPIILRIPNFQISIHIGIYLPTHGKDVEFVSDLAELKICIDELQEKYPGAIFFIRGDGNVNAKNKKRVNLLEHFMTDLSLKRVPLFHKTYHHFVGLGSYDSDIDLILHSSAVTIPETVSEILCKLEQPLILSHHDIIVSKFSVPADSGPDSSYDDLVTM